MLALTSSVYSHVICQIGYKAPSIRNLCPHPQPPTLCGDWPDIQWSGSPDCQSNCGLPNLWRLMKPTTWKCRRGGAGRAGWWGIIICISANLSCQTLADKMNAVKSWRGGGRSGQKCVESSSPHLSFNGHCRVPFCCSAFRQMKGGALHSPSPSWNRTSKLHVVLNGSGLQFAVLTRSHRATLSSNLYRYPPSKF